MGDDVSIDKLIESIALGGAVCLVGAGFSTGATDAYGEPVPSSAGLVSEIKLCAGIDDSEQVGLTDIADYCEEDNVRSTALRKLLIKRLTLCKPTADQVAIMSAPWRSIFSTNFDDVAERCFPTGVCQAITPQLDLSVHDPAKRPLYYLHGRARDLIESDVDPRFVISDRNYLNLHEDNRALYSRLKNELFCASVVVVVGYSMRDLEIARLLIEGGRAFRRKTVIICHPDEKAVSITRLKKFGTVLPIGVSEFASNLSAATAASRAPGSPRYQFIDHLQPVQPSDEIEGDDFVKLILTGVFSREKYQAQLQQSTGASELYAVRRGNALDEIVGRSAAGINRYVISSDLGNGKSVFLDQLAEELVVSGRSVIRISSDLTEVFDELERALGTGQEAAFLIDDVIRHRRVAQFIGARITSGSILVCAVRGDPNEVALSELINSLGGTCRTIDLNHLSLGELQAWDQALERWGLWEQRIELPVDQRLRFLSDACAGENRSIVLSLFRSSRVAAKIDQIVSFFVNDGRHHKAFAALLISSLCQKHVDWQSLVSWLDIDEGKLRHDIMRSDISALFVSGREWNVLTSAQLAEYILRTKYLEIEKDILVETFSTIVLCTAESASDSYLGAVFRENLKELMKFRFLTRLFGDGDAAVRVIGIVYSRLSKARLIRENPQFWLQYAMSRMEVSDLENAETYLNTALGLAKDRGLTYSPFQTLDQRARLYFRKNSEAEGAFKKSEIDAAVRDLDALLSHPDSEIIYLYRSVPLIRDFIDLHIDVLQPDFRANLRSLLEKIGARGEGFRRLPRSQKGETEVLQRAMRDALTTLEYG